jgi:hypothetical protein
MRTASSLSLRELKKGVVENRKVSHRKLLATIICLLGAHCDEARKRPFAFISAICTAFSAPPHLLEQPVAVVIVSQYAPAPPEGRRLSQRGVQSGVPWLYFEYYAY